MGKKVSISKKKYITEIRIKKTGKNPKAGIAGFADIRNDAE